MTRTTTLDPLAEVHASLDRLAVDPDGLDEPGQAAYLQSITRAEAKLAAIRLSVLASADRASAAARSGAASTGQWAARLTNADQTSTHRQVGLAQRLDRRAATRLALSAGDITPAHAEVIVRADSQLPASVTDEQRDTVEAMLISKARTLPPTGLRKAARRALSVVEDDLALVDAHENGVVRDQEEFARSRTRLTLHDNGDGTVSGHFVLPVLQGHLLRKVLATMTAPRRGRLGATQAQAGDHRARSDWDRARGEAFGELVEHLPTDHLHPRTAGTLVVTLDQQTLRDALKVAHLDTGESLSAGEARRLACNARLLPAVLGGSSLPLDLGRSARLFSEAQRIAVGLRHSTCAADGCERPFAWTELHHRRPWSHGGGTDLAAAIPLCHFHHQRIHDPGYEHTEDGDGILRFHRRT